VDLLLGAHVRERGRRVGRLAGFELEPSTLRIRRIIFSADGDLGPQAMTRPLASVVASSADGGDIEVEETDSAPLPAVPDVALLSRATRIRRGRHDHGRFVGLAVSQADRALVSVFGRQHLWSRRFSVSVREADFSTPGEIRLGSSNGGTRAA
jgi:hypothetical protein